MGFEPTIPASERAKIVHALDGSATVTGIYLNTTLQIEVLLYFYRSVKVDIF
jgi:hypothetical protein